MAQTDLGPLVEALAAGNATKAQQAEAAKTIWNLVGDYNTLLARHNELQDAGLQMMKMIEEMRNRAEQRVLDCESEVAKIQERIALAEAEYEARKAGKAQR